jgi:hypothetical protein
MGGWGARLQARHEPQGTHDGQHGWSVDHRNQHNGETYICTSCHRDYAAENTMSNASWGMARHRQGGHRDNGHADTECRGPWLELLVHLGQCGQQEHRE